MARPTGELVGRVLGGRYRLLALIGTGASAQVYLADDVKLRRRVAIKLLHDALADDEAFLRRFRVEAQLAAQLSHPHILVVHDWNDGANALGEPPYLVTEYLEGGSLRTVLDVGERLSPSQALLIGLQAARGLEHAHAKGYVHRDIKPANLLFGEDGRVRIGDFGLARALAEAAWTEPAGAVLGTARYASPEQARGGSVNGKADVYALALVLIEAVTGSVPFAADTTIGTLMARVDRDLEPPSELGALGDALRPAGLADPAARCDAAALVIAFERAARELPRPAPITIGMSTMTAAPDRVDPTEHGIASATADVSAATANGRARGDRPAPAALPPSADRSFPRDSSSHGPSPTEPEHGFDAGVPAPHTGRPVPQLPTPDEVARDGVSDGGVTAAGGEGVRTARSKRRRGRVAALAFLVVLIAGGAGGWWWRSRPKYHTAPNLTAMSLAEARKQAEPQKFRIVSAERYSETEIADVILSQKPEAGRLREGSRIDVVVSKGPKPRKVPDLAGLSLDEATQALVGVQLGRGAVTPRPDEDAAADIVLEWSPVGQVARGGLVDLVVSSGPRPRVVARINGMSPEKAKQALEAEGLVGVVIETPSDTVKKGVVISANYPARTERPRGSKVQIIVSSGPELIAIPDVRGKSAGDAEAVLRSAGFTVAGTEGSPSGSVSLTRPTAGTRARKGTAVTLVTQ